MQEGLRESHTPLVETLDAIHALLLVLVINVDTPTRYVTLSPLRLITYIFSNIPSPAHQCLPRVLYIHG